MKISIFHNFKYIVISPERYMRVCQANSKCTYKSFYLFIRLAQSLLRDLGGWVYASIPTDIVYSESYAALKIKKVTSDKYEGVQRIRRVPINPSICSLEWRYRFAEISGGGCTQAFQQISFTLKVMRL